MSVVGADRLLADRDRGPNTPLVPDSIDVRALSARIGECMLVDQGKLRARLGGRGGRGLEWLAAEVEKSALRRTQRLANLPRPSYPPDLPVSARKDDIARAIAGHQVVVLCGETGSGKTTQLPKICLELGRGVAGLIGHTQPRRIAARSVATRIAEELGSPLGQDVGYKVRFGDHTGPRTYVKVMTDGILLAETQGDRFLEQYDTIIIDEAHERSLNIDFLLGYLRQLLPRRPDLKLIITSATIDPERFAVHFARGGKPAPIVEVSGRMYPVEVRYRPLQSEDPDEQDRDLEQAVLDAVDEIARQERGDMLIFMSGEREIRETAEALRKHHPPSTEVVPLYARLSGPEQHRVFEPHPGKRRIVIATNVAETSLTVPGIRAVIDPGLARISRYSARTKVQRLPIEVVSRASADQRKGRCGRLGPGICIRLYSEDDFLSRPQFTEPEILRTNLASVILQMKALRLGDVESFPFVEPPDGRMIRDGYETLHELGAVDEQNNLTALGANLARLPIDPRIGRMILAAKEENALREVLVIAAALSVQDPRERPLDKQEAADQAHAQFKHEDSDFVAYLNIWNFYKEQEEALSHSKLRKACRENFLSYLRMREWEDIHRQLHALVADMGLHENKQNADYDAIHKALLAGLLSSVGLKGENYEYTAPRGTKFNIFPGSGLFKKGPKWVVAEELVKTTKLYARTVAKIQPEWIERIGAHLVKRTYSEPHWDVDTARVYAFEKVSLFGLEIVPRRRVHFGIIDPVVSRELFIRHALVEGEYRAEGAYVQHNAALIADIRALEAKARRTDLLLGSDARFEFFDRRLPLTTTGGQEFERWRLVAEKKDARVLFMRHGDLLASVPEGLSAERFPDSIRFGEVVVPLTYKFDPGAPDDGITMTVPLEALHQIDAGRCEWLVPGRLKEKIEELARALPKSVRKFAQTPAVIAAEAERVLSFGKGSLLEALATYIGRASGAVVSPASFKHDQVPAHLLMNFRVVEERGRVVAMGRDLAAMQRELGERVRQSLGRLAGESYRRTGLTEWDFGDLPERVEVSRQGVTVAGYPALVDEGGTVSLRLLETRETAELLMRGGLRRLFANMAREELDYQGRIIPDIETMGAQYATLGRGGGGRKQLVADLEILMADRAFLGGGGAGEQGGEIRTKAAFDRRFHEGWDRLHRVRDEVCRNAREILAAYQGVRLRLDGSIPPAWEPAVLDMREQLTHLVYPNFLSRTPAEWLAHYPRYLAAIQSRLRKLAVGGESVQRDERHSIEVAPYWRVYVEQAARHKERGLIDPALELYRWMLEEYRVSLFAQELRTAIPVSGKRLHEQWDRVQP
jgi:ATP-dependent helicase HrpA